MLETLQFSWGTRGQQLTPIAIGPDCDWPVAWGGFIDYSWIY